MAEISDEKYEQLRLILEKQNGRTYTFEEAKEIGDGLVDFFKLLIMMDENDYTEEATEDEASPRHQL